MEMRNVVSSTIQAVGWENNALFVRFESGQVYMYTGVPQQKYTEMLNAESKGRYLTENIKPHYISSRLTV